MTPARHTLVIVALVIVAGLAGLWIRQQVTASALEIVAAEYGVPGQTCSAGPEVMKRATDACGGFRPRCLVSVSTGWCGDPAPGLVKTLTVDYTCGGSRKRVSAPDGTGLELACP